MLLLFYHYLFNFKYVFFIVFSELDYFMVIEKICILQETYRKFNQVKLKNLIYHFPTFFTTYLNQMKGIILKENNSR